jgi:hypothetical protein
MQINVLQIIATAVISAVVTGCITYIGVVRKAVKSLKEGLLSLLRAELIRSHDKYTKKRLCPLYAKEALEKAYKAYSALGGNGAMKQVFEETMRLPIEEKEQNDE